MCYMYNCRCLLGFQCPGGPFAWGIQFCSKINKDDLKQEARNWAYTHIKQWEKSRRQEMTNIRRSRQLWRRGMIKREIRRIMCLSVLSFRRMVLQLISQRFIVQSMGGCLEMAIQWQSIRSMGRRRGKRSTVLFSGRVREIHNTGSLRI